MNPKQACGYIAAIVPPGFVSNVYGVPDVLSLPYVHRNQLDNLSKLMGKTVSIERIDKTARMAITLSAPDLSQLEKRAEIIRGTLGADVVLESGGVQPLIWG